MGKIEIPYFDLTTEKGVQKRNDWLMENKDRIIAVKKAALKYADGVGHYSLGAPMLAGSGEPTMKAVGEPIDPNTLKGELVVLAAINTTNIMDSHSDVHIPGLWKRSLSMLKIPMFLQEHKMGFEYIIADGKDVKVSAKRMNWKELGFDYPGVTEVLMFNATVKQSRNAYMFDQYAKAYVKNHSVGMRYKEIVFCLDDERYGAEKEAFDKYIPMVVNADEAQEQGYFWAVKEAQVIEGSAVPLGSNQATPVISISSKGSTIEAKGSEASTHSNSPGEETKELDYEYLMKNLNKLKPTEK